MIELLKYLCTILNIEELVQVQKIVSKYPRLFNKNDIDEMVKEASILEQQILSLLFFSYSFKCETQFLCFNRM